MDRIPEQQEPTEHLSDFSDDTAPHSRPQKYLGRHGNEVQTAPASGPGAVPGVGIDRNEYSDEGDWD